MFPSSLQSAIYIVAHIEIVNYFSVIEIVDYLSQC